MKPPVPKPADAFTAAALEPVVRAWCEAQGEDFGFGKVVHPVRVAVTGRAEGPGFFEVLELLGKERVLARLRAALPKCG
jgi:glutamyl-tRNA synthetase